MNRNLLAITVLVALSVLTFVQFRLLVIGAKLEKQRFDQQLLVAQRNIRQALDQPNTVSEALVEHLKVNDRTSLKNPVLSDSLAQFIQQEIARVGASPRFSFAIASRYNTKELSFVSNEFKADLFTFNEYVVPLGNYFSSRIFSEKTLHIDVENLFTYLLTELDYLVIPSVLCLLALLISLWLLINILQKEQQLNKVKNDFINNLTHELKTPAFSISLSGKLAKDHLQKGNYDKVAEFLGIIEKENNKLKSHTEKVLELASLENPKHQLQKEVTDLHDLLNALVNDFNSRLKEVDGQIATALQADQYTLAVDQSHFKNVVYNLLDNATKYGGQPPIIRLNTQSKEGIFTLQIADRGPGINATHQKYIFDKFYRIPRANTNTIKGFGLGLNYVKQVIQSHGGNIRVESRPDEGATFIIELPI